MALKCFGKFLCERGYFPENPLQHVPKSGEAGEEGARPLSFEEASGIIEVFCRHHMTDKRAVPESSVMAALLFKTGWRPFMLYGIRACDLSLDAEIPHYTTHPSWTKNKRRMHIALDREAVLLIRWLLRRWGAKGEDKLCQSQINRATWKQFVNEAGVVYGTRTSGLACMYSARKSFATWLNDANVAAGTREWLLAHWDTYTKPNLRAQAESLQRLHEIWPKFARKFLENTPDGAKKYNAGPRTSVENSYNQSHANPLPTTRPARSIFVGGSHFEGLQRPSTPEVPHENGHSRAEKSGVRSVIERAMGLLEYQADLLRMVIEACADPEGIGGHDRAETDRV